jgi:hypothetical protein
MNHGALNATFDFGDNNNCTIGINLIFEIF